MAITTLSAGGPSRLPECMNDASTRSSLLKGPGHPSTAAGWLYYQKPVRNYLKGLGCAPDDLEDLTHEILIKLQTYIVVNYNPMRPFRPYFKAAIRNFYFSHLRARSQTACSTGVDDLAGDLAGAEPAAEPADGGEVLATGLLDYARQVYDHFAADSGAALSGGIRMLQAWIISGDKQEELAAAWNLTDRQVRTHIARAADALARWMQERLHPDDLDSLVRLARAKGVKMDLTVADIRGLFSHLSKQKRIRVLLILSLIYKRETMPAAVD